MVCCMTRLVDNQLIHAGFQAFPLGIAARRLRGSSITHYISLESCMCLTNVARPGVHSLFSFLLWLLHVSPYLGSWTLDIILSTCFLAAQWAFWSPGDCTASTSR